MARAQIKLTGEQILFLISLVVIIGIVLYKIVSTIMGLI